LFWGCSGQPESRHPGLFQSSQATVLELLVVSGSRQQCCGACSGVFLGCFRVVLGSFWVVLGLFWGCSGVVLGLFWGRFRVLDVRFASRDAVKATLGSFSCWIQWKPSQWPETREESAKFRSSRTRYFNYGSSRARSRPTRSGRKRARNGARSEIARNENTAPSF